MDESKPIKHFLKAKFARLLPAYRGIRQWASELRPKKSVFNAIYRHRTWDDSESISGPGSNLKQTEGLRAELPGLLAKLKTTSLLDAPCGDFNWMRETKLDLENYIGADIVPDLIAENRKKFGTSNRSFVVLDLTTDVLPRVDVIFCRDCLVHLSHKNVTAALKNFKRSGSKYLLTTTYPGVQENHNIATGGWRPLNLQLSPFHLPEPDALVDERAVENNGIRSNKHLGLWSLARVNL